MPEPTSTLVVAPNWVGDNVMALPFYAALAADGRRLTMLARHHLHPLLELVPAVTELIPRVDDATTVRALERSGCGEAVLLPNSFHAAWLARRAAIPRRWGYRGNWRSLLLAPAVPKPRTVGRHQVLDYCELLAAMGVDAPASWTPRLELPATLREAAGQWLHRAAVPASGGPLVGLFPGAAFSPSRRWPAERFAALSHRLRATVPGIRQLILAGPRELDIAIHVREASGRLHPVVGPDLDLAALAGVLARLDLLITNDSGPMHLAAALGVPCAGLFGPTDPARTAPRGAGHQILYTDRWCSPCFRRRCPLLHQRCLRDIEVEQVVAATRTRLVESSEPRVTEPG